MLTKGERAGAQRGRERISCLKFSCFALKVIFLKKSVLSQQDLHTQCRPLGSLSIRPSPRNTLKAHTDFILAFLYSIFWPHWVACGIFVPWLGIKDSTPSPAMEAWSPNQWTIWGVLCHFILFLFFFYNYLSNLCWVFIALLVVESGGYSLVAVGVFFLDLRFHKV